MKSKAFADGMVQMEVALQDKFEAGFGNYLWKVLEKVDEAHWKACVERLARGMRKPRELTVGVFLETISEIKADLRREKGRWKVAPHPEKTPDWKAIAKKIEDDPEAPAASRDLARELSERTTDAPKPKGGEKYRAAKNG